MITLATMVNMHSRKFLRCSRNRRRRRLFSPCATTLEKHMTKLSYVLAALATIAVGVPTVASATEFGVRIGGDRDHYRDYGPRVGFYGHDRGWHRGWYNHDYDRDRVVIRHHHWDD
jgi:hypothetical protein